MAKKKKPKLPGNEWLIPNDFDRNMKTLDHKLLKGTYSVPELLLAATMLLEFSDARGRYNLRSAEESMLADRASDILYGMSHYAH